MANIELSTTPIFLCAASDARPDVDDARYCAEQLFMHLNERFKRSAMAYSGCEQAIPMIIEYTKDEELSRIAGGVFACITGVDIEEDDLSPIDPDGDLSSLSADKNPWQQDYEIDLAKPGVEELVQWWNAHQSPSATLPNG
ncbi:hypothetical protein KDW99_01495 [Marinomonas rhizomae]|uniref:hypothetical protein n=1 Tax=Marinomonas rhizomae TaxID=491948 RepID=UPI0021056076|nr:hypothetical protein [Marinomonas rhizomae]UTV99851.1 hypothetical protein KDW99_01495 [Marinomonas rhizomae]